MLNTNFANSSGINDPDNYSTVRDIMHVNYLIKKHPEYYKWFSEKNLHGIELEEIQLLKVIEIHYYIKIWSDGIKTGYLLLNDIH